MRWTISSGSNGLEHVEVVIERGEVPDVLPHHLRGDGRLTSFRAWKRGRQALRRGPERVECALVGEDAVCGRRLVEELVVVGHRRSWIVGQQFQWHYECVYLNRASDTRGYHPSVPTDWTTACACTRMP